MAGESDLHEHRGRSDRDGTSQADRRLAALDPAYVAIDERTVRDRLEFVRAFARTLRWYDLGPDDEAPRAAGDWRAFLPDELDLDTVVDFLADPESFNPDDWPLLHRPHFSLLLVFLELLDRVQGKLNGFGRRHLDFYYRRILRLAARPPVSDRVRLLFELAPGVEAARIPAGTRVDAGPDSAGVDRIYATDRDLVVSRARIARLSTLRVERQVTDFAAARRRYRNDPEATAAALFELALGDPRPGDPLAPWPGTTERPADTAAWLADRHRLVRMASSRLFFRHFFELRELIQLKTARDPVDWGAIAALRERATGLTYAGLSEVRTLDDLYDQRARDDVRDFVRRAPSAGQEGLGVEFEHFVRVLAEKRAVDEGWIRIRRLLGDAGRRRDPAFAADPLLEGLVAGDFAALLEAAVGRENLDALPGGSLETWWQEVLRLEAAFQMRVEAFDWVMEAVARGDATAPAEWAKVDRVLTEAHRRKVWSGRRAHLRSIRQEGGASAVLRHALGEAPVAGDTVASLLPRLEPYLGGPDFGLLRQALLPADAEQPLDEDGWVRVETYAEVAWRNREGLPPPVPRHEEWINLHPAADASAAQVVSGISGEQERWRTFGDVPRIVPDEAPPPVMGWAFASPLLALAEGERTIRLLLGFRADGFDAELLEPLLEDPDRHPFHLAVSSEKGWIEPAGVDITVSSYVRLGGTVKTTPALRGVRLTLRYPVDADPLMAPGDGSSAWPVLRLMLRQVRDTADDGTPTGPWRSLYPPLRNLVLGAVRAEVEVAGLVSVAARNDEGVVDATAAFEPFGTRPADGSRFTLGHPELVTKRLGRLRFHLPWMAAPGDLGTYYAGYDPKPAGTVTVQLVDRRRTSTLASQAPLFAEGGTLEIADTGAALPEGQVYAAREIDTSSADPRAWSRYLEWRLEAPDFRHTAYPALALERSVALAAAVANAANADPPGSVDAGAFQVNPPYTPQLSHLAVDYDSSLELRLDATAVDGEAARLLHLHPFGTSDAEHARTAEGIPFLPRYDHEGELLIGLAEVTPPQTLSLFFQLAEGSADPDLPRPPVRWSALSGDRWTSLDEAGNVRSDTTRGLINSGIVELVLEPVAPSTRLPDAQLPGGLYWLRAAVAADTAALCDTVAVHTQAVAATFIDQGNAADHFDRPLPAGSISELTTRRPEVAAVHQPYTSFGGRRAEAPEHFNTRVAERLRHKNRALTVWDFERLVLERFPELYKVKCVPAWNEPGRVTVVVIPDMRGQLPFDPFEPKAPADLLVDVEGFLRDRAPAAARIVVTNPHYVAVRVRLAVRFRERGNEELDKQRLTEELNRHLSPWAYEEGADIVIGGKIFAHSLVDFLDRRPYVDYLADVRLFSSDDGETFHLAQSEEGAGTAVTAARPDAVLVAARRHQIDLIPETGYAADALTGINFMQLELDLVVA